MVDEVRVYVFVRFLIDFDHVHRRNHKTCSGPKYTNKVPAHVQFFDWFHQLLPLCNGNGFYPLHQYLAICSPSKQQAVLALAG